MQPDTAILGAARTIGIWRSLANPWEHKSKGRARFIKTIKQLFFN
jgi:hypothetical protein